MKATAAFALVGFAAGGVARPAAASDSTSHASPGLRFRGVDLPQSHQLRERNVDSTTSNYVEMESISSQSPHPVRQKLNSLHAYLADGWDLTSEAAAPNPPANPSASNMTLLFNSDYVIPISIGNQNFKISVDTTSGDTWVVQTNFTCLGPTLDPIDSELCTPGPTFNGTFKYGFVPGAANFSLRYGEEGYVSGRAGYEDVTLAGVTVKKQEMLLATESTWGGNKITSGSMGLGYPLQTRIFNTTSPDDSYPGSPTHQKYDPIFTSMYKQGLVSPMFSMAMNRSAEKGWLAIGGLPPVDHSPDFVKTKIRIVGLHNSPATQTENSFYTIIPDGFRFGNLSTGNFTYSNPSWNGLFNDTNKSQFPVIIDSSMRFSYLPREIVLPYVKQFEGPVGRFDGQYWAPCTTTAPPFGVTIGGKTLYLNQADLVHQDLRQERDYHGTPIMLCLVGLMDTFPDGPFIFGNGFLNNFVTVFDVGAAEMRFYTRK